jgi:hypothetical protein
MPAKQDSLPIWLWPNVLSLDAPIVAVLWQGFLSHRFDIPLRPAGRLALGLTVWAIYLLDRLLDVRKPAPANCAGGEPARHRFYRRHSNTMAALLMVVLVADAAVALLGLRPAILREGLIPLAGVLLYMLAFHLSRGRVRIPKEIAASILFTAGTFVAAWAALPCVELLWAGLAFFILCLANMIAIEAWERRELDGTARWLANTYLIWVPLVVVLCAVVGRNDWYASIALSAGACALLFWAGRRLSLDARRALVDGVLLTPLLFLVLR